MSQQGGPVLFQGNPNGAFMAPTAPQDPNAPSQPIDPNLLAAILRIRGLNFGGPVPGGPAGPPVAPPLQVAPGIPLPPPTRAAGLPVPPPSVDATGQSGPPTPPPVGPWTPTPSIAQPNIGDFYRNLPPFPVPDLQRRAGLELGGSLLGLALGAKFGGRAPGAAANIGATAAQGAGAGYDTAEQREQDLYNRQLQLSSGRFGLAQQQVAAQNDQIDKQNTVGAFNARTQSTANNVDKRVQATTAGQQAGLMKAGAAALPKALDYWSTLDHDGQVAAIMAHNQTYGTHVPVPGTPSGQFTQGTDQDGNPVRVPVMIADLSQTPTDRLRQAQIAKDEQDTAKSLAQTGEIPLAQKTRQQIADQLGTYQKGLVTNGQTQAGAAVTRAGAAVTTAGAAKENADTNQFREQDYLQSVNNQNYWNISKINDDRVKIAQANGQTKDPAKMSVGQLMAEQVRLQAPSGKTVPQLGPGGTPVIVNGNPARVPVAPLSETSAGQAYNTLLKHYIDVKSSAQPAAGTGSVLPALPMPPPGVGRTPGQPGMVVRGIPPVPPPKVTGSGSPVVPSSQAAFDALPVGAAFLKPGDTKVWYKQQ